jgi:hypothetical protein
VTEALAPAVLMTLLLLAVGWHAAGQAGGEGLLWGLLASLFACLIPMGYIVRGVRRGSLTDHHVGLREIPQPGEPRSGTRPRLWSERNVR